MGNASNRGIEILHPKRITSTNNCKVDIIERGATPTVARDPSNGHVYLLMDCSGSMAGDKIEQAIKEEFGDVTVTIHVEPDTQALQRGVLVL